METLFIILVSIFSFSAGVVGQRLYFDLRRVGKLHIETSDPDGPLLFVELKQPIEYLMDKNEVVLEIDTENYISHE